MKKNNVFRKLKMNISKVVKKLVFVIFGLIMKTLLGSLLVLIAILLYVLENLEYLLGLCAAAWVAYLMWNEYGKAMASFSFFVIVFLVCIAVNTGKKGADDN